jgi:hypothetical protein
MKLKSAFTINLLIITAFTLLAVLSYNLNIKNSLTPFFIALAVIFLMILPACSTKR